METNNTNLQLVLSEQDERKPFILGNTRPMDLTQLQEDYLVPVFSRDNVETISHSDFINVVADAAQTFFHGEQFTQPQIRVSHEMIVRTRSENGKLVENLEKDDSGSYYQRMMFMIELPNISYTINGNTMNLQIVGVRSYSETTLLGKQLTAWNFYQLLTNYKNNYIDITMERCVNAYDVARGLAAAINRQDSTWNWFIE